MVLFESFTGRRSMVKQRLPGRKLPEAVRRGLPIHFEAVGEALASGSSTSAACSVVGRDVARDGAALGEALDGLRATYRLLRQTTPDFAAAEALSVAWAEESLESLHAMSCEDPLTGLASLAHVRTRLEELYRDSDRAGGSVRFTHALVIVEMTFSAPLDPGQHPFTRALHLVRLCELTRTVFSGGETIGRLGLDHVVVVVRRGPQLGGAVTLLRELFDDLGLGSARVRVWIEGLPETAASANGLLNGLAR